LARDAKKNGTSYNDPAEVYPKNAKDAVALYERVFPVKLPNRQTIEDSLGVPEAFGKSFNDLIEKQLKEIRDNIGHTLIQKLEDLILTDDPTSQSKVEKWLPPLKLMARAMLFQDFPAGF
jgi:hypothetical protein